MHAQLITAALALAGSAFAGKLPNVHTTSTVTLYEPKHTESTSTAEHHSACTVCPKDYDRNWDSDRVLNDTRKHHSSFMLFAYPDDISDEASIPPQAGFPLHVVTHGKSRDNMWQLKLGNPMNADAKSQFDQPKWNLYGNSLQTDGSAPINDILYFRLYDGKYPKDTENWTGTVFHPIATTMKNKKKYEDERNAKLIADKGWSLVREDENPFAYTLKGSKPAGNFFACVNPDAMNDAVAIPPPSVFDDDEPDVEDVGDFMSGMMGMAISKFELVYSEERPKQEFSTAGNSLVDPKGCRPVTIKAEGWTHPKQA